MAISLYRRYKKFGGKRYALAKVMKHKRDANKSAEKAREMGKSARVTQLGKGYGKWQGYWAVWRTSD